MVNETTGAHEESIETAVAVNFAYAVEKSTDNIVTTGSLTTRQNHTHIHRFRGRWSGILLEFQFGKAIGVGKQFLDSLLVGNRLGSLPLNGTHRSGEHDGQLGLISCTGFLQSALLHKIISL